MLGQESFREGWSEEFDLGGAVIRVFANLIRSYTSVSTREVRVSDVQLLSSVLLDDCSSARRLLLRVLYVDCHAVGQYRHLLILGVGLLFVPNLDRGFDVGNRILWFVNDLVE